MFKRILKYFGVTFSSDKQEEAIPSLQSNTFHEPQNDTDICLSASYYKPQFSKIIFPNCKVSYPKLVYSDIVDVDPKSEPLGQGGYIGFNLVEPQYIKDIVDLHLTESFL